MQHRPPKPRRETAAYRWSRVIQHRPWPFAIGAAALLLVLALPFLSLRLGFSDESNFADDTTTKQAYDLVVEGFGEGSTGPVYLVAEVDGAEQAGALAAVNEAVAADPAVAAVLGPQPNDPDEPDRGAVAGHADGRPAGRGDHRPRRPAARRRAPADRGGERRRRAGHRRWWPRNVDMSQYMAERMPIFFGGGAHAVVPAADGRVPLAAGAAQGRDHEPAVDRRGLRRHRRPVPVGLAAATSPACSRGPIETWVPMMLFAVVFGLSMDYEVFLLSRIREEWRRTGDSRTSVADGLAATAKVITAAAAIMVVVFGSFMLEFERTMKMMGTGLAVAIFLDATIVRMVLVPGDDGAARRPQLVAAPLARPDPPEHRRRGPRRGAPRRSRTKTSEREREPALTD